MLDSEGLVEIHGLRYEVSVELVQVRVEQSGEIFR